MIPSLRLAPEVEAALTAKQPVVALESTLIAHGLPWPLNLETAREAEAAIRLEGAIPATIAVWRGAITIGLSPQELEALARDRQAIKASRRDLAAAVAQGRTAATTVSATMFLAHQAGIRLFATGGIGGVHRDAGRSFDVSADLLELSGTPVCVVCAGVKSILDIQATLEVLESNSVPVVGYRTDEFPAFFLRSSGDRLDTRVNTPREAAELLRVHWQLDGAGVVLAQPPPAEFVLDPEDLAAALTIAEQEAQALQIRGKAITPFLLSRLAELTNGKTLRVNRVLVVENARLAAQVAVAFAQLGQIP